MSKLYATVVLGLLWLHAYSQHINSNVEHITFAASFDFSKPPQTLAARFEPWIKAGLEFFQHWMHNTRNRLGGPQYNITLDIKNSGSDIDLKKQHYSEWCSQIRNGSKIYLFGGFDESFINVSHAIDRHDECFRIDSGVFKEESWTNFKNVLPLRASLKHYWESIYPYLRLHNVKRAIVIRQLRDDLRPYYDNLLEGLKWNVDIVPEETFYVMDSQVRFGALEPDVLVNVTDTVRELAQIYPDIDCLFILAWEGVADDIVPLMEEFSWAPKMVIHVLAGSFLWKQSGNMHSGIREVSTRTAFKSDNFTGGNYTSWLSQLAEFQNATSEEVDSLFFLNPFMAGSFLIQAIEKAGTFEHIAVKETLFRSKFSTFNGDYSWDITHGQKWRPYFVQVQNRDGKYEGEDFVEILGPIEASTNTMEYPIIPWKDRTQNLDWGSFGEIPISVLAIIAILSCVVVSIYTTIGEKKSLRPFPLFIVLISFGGIIFAATTFIWPPSVFSSTACHLYMYFFHIGFTLFFGTLFSKALLIVIGHRDKDDAVRVRSMSVVVVVLGLVVIDAVILILYSVIYNPKSVKVSPDDFDMSKTYIICDGNDTAERTFEIIFAAEKGILIVIGFVLAYFVKDTRSYCRHHTKVIAFSIYNTGIFFIVIVTLQISLGDFDRAVVTLVYVLSSIGIICAVVFTMLAFMLQYIFWGSETDFSAKMDDTSFGMDASITPGIGNTTLKQPSRVIATPARSPATTNTTGTSGTATLVTTGSRTSADFKQLVEDANARLEELEAKIVLAKDSRNKWKTKYENAEQRMSLIENQS